MYITAKFMFNRSRRKKLKNATIHKNNIRMLLNVSFEKFCVLGSSSISIVNCDKLGE